MEIQTIEISKINPSKYNPRKDLQPGDSEYEKLKKSILEFDMVEPLVINKRTGNLISGHQRIKILKELGKTEVESVIVELSETKEKALNLALNKISGEWDSLKLKDILEELDCGQLDDIEITGFDDIEIEDLMTQFYVDDEKDDEVPEVPEEPITKLGDLYKLENHRLLCGNATKTSDVERLMGGQKADMVFTDPPYGMNLEADWTGAKGNMFGKNMQGSRYDSVIGDHLDFTNEFINTIFSNFGYCKEIFLWGADYYMETIPNKNKGSIFVWDKRLDDNADKMYGSCFELCWSKNKHKRDIARIKWAGLFGVASQDIKRRIHPTQKPIELCDWFINKFSNKDNLIIDLFGGSGSTLIACEKLNRRCYMMEIDPHYCDVIVKRWENYTGKKAELI